MIKLWHHVLKCRILISRLWCRQVCSSVISLIAHCGLLKRPVPGLSFLPWIFSLPGHTLELNQSKHLGSGEAKYLSELWTDLKGETKSILLLAAALYWEESAMLYLFSGFLFCSIRGSSKQNNCSFAHNVYSWNLNWYCTLIFGFNTVELIMLSFSRMRITRSRRTLQLTWRASFAGSLPQVIMSVPIPQAAWQCPAPGSDTTRLAQSGITSIV